MRANTIQNILDKKFKTLELSGVWADALGQPEISGIWLIYGEEKHGKTAFSLMLAETLSKQRKTQYIMAEQGFDADFQNALKRLKMDVKNRNLIYDEYIPVEELSHELKKRKRADIILLDNATIYADELKNGGLRKLVKTHPNKLFVLIAHEDKGQPYTATAKLAKKLAKRIIRVEGMAATVEGRGPGGKLVIDEEKAQLYHGTN